MRSLRLAILPLIAPVFLEAQAATTVANPVQEFAIDAGHTIVEFSLKFAFSRIKGRFTDTKGTILYNSADPSRSSITVVIDAKSLDTGWGHRDEHLRTSDFFDVEKYPTIVFQSDGMTRTSNGWRADGKLTMRGVTKAISIPFRLTHPPGRGTEGTSLIIGAEGGLKLARADFGLTGGSTFNSWFTKARAATMGDSADISIELEGWASDLQGQRIAIEPTLERIKTGGVQAVIDRYTNVYRTTPNVTFGLVNGADFTTRALIGMGKTDDAVKLSKAVVELLPSESRVHIVHGVALAVAGKTQDAMREYAKAKEVFKPVVPDPNEKFPQDDPHWYYLDELARTLVSLNKPAIAVPVARTIAELYPKTARAHTMLGVALAASGDKRAAAEAYARALAVNPNDTRALEYRRHL